MSRIILAAEIYEGDSGNCAKCPELEVSFNSPTLDGAIIGLRIIVQDHCNSLVKRGGTSTTTPLQLELAQKVVERGFSFRFK